MLSFVVAVRLLKLLTGHLWLALNLTMTKLLGSRRVVSWSRIVRLSLVVKNATIPFVIMTELNKLGQFVVVRLNLSRLFMSYIGFGRLRRVVVTNLGLMLMFMMARFCVRSLVLMCLGL